jgi:hypothetical protein
MAESEMVNELARRAGVSRAEAEALLHALDEMSRDGGGQGHAAPASATIATAGFAGMAGRPFRTAPVAAGAYVPSGPEIDALIAAAEKHPLGLQFLLEGDLGAVAISFGAHAFTVDAARQRLRTPGA